MTDKQQVLIWKIEELKHQLSVVRGQFSSSLTDREHELCGEELRVLGHAINRISAVHHTLTHKLENE